MTTSFKSVSNKAGLPPGSLVYVGNAPDVQGRMSVIDYNLNGVERPAVQSVQDLLAYRDRDTVTWVIIEGVNDTGLISDIGKHFNVHQLVLEDILNTHQRPKFEEHEEYLFIVLKAMSPGAEGEIHAEQISLLVFEKIVFTFKERHDDLFQPVVRRINNSKGQFKGAGSDYLAYVLLDTIVDQYFHFHDAFDEKIDAVEEVLLIKPTSKMLAKIQDIKRSLIVLRKSISPLREVINEIQHSEAPLICEETRIYFRDVRDHVLRISDTIDTYRDMVSGLLDIYVSSVSNKMNEVMKVLTVFASIFIPLTFIVGIYGMNFEYMPELKWKWAYPALWGVFLIVPVVLLIYFRRKKWI